jgi:isoleucyl-tRNA synthetase
MVDYKDTICLPRTGFPMKASLSRREPEFLELWKEKRVYERLLDKTSGGERFVFHDGPPYANGGIHHGHVLNKVLKDIVTKYRSLKGRHVRYIPGWDCHGLPIELNVERELGKPSDEADRLSIRKRCEQFALKWSNHQLAELRRLGVFSLWDEAYRTIDRDYEQVVVEELARIVERGLVYRGHKPVYWCAGCRTALAEAEVEYGEHTSPSIYVTYPALDADELAEALGLEKDGAPPSVMIWTTTPWTLPASLVVAVHPSYRYRAYAVGEQRVVVAEEMAERAFGDCRVEAEPLGRAVPGQRLAGLRVRHPFIEREVPILVADYVTLEAGTGCVHTAPGHGQEDYVLCAGHGIDAYAPVDENGRFTDEVERWAGKGVFDANPEIVELLAESGALLNPPDQTIDHQYPACWRCKQPVIFRATPQWFVSMDRTGLREEALAEIDRTRWIPPWGRDRIHGMVENRPDWCISRQRVWGVPLPFFFCEKCGEPLVDAGVIRHVAKIFGEHGSDEWWKREAAELLPDGVECAACGGRSFGKEANIVDVWFESGVSWAAVAQRREGMSVPVDLYLEGSDQHRGWFHTALLTATATRGHAPYRAVLTHGFITNEKGEILSKSQRNFVPPQKIVDQQGAEILRLWVGYEDYRSDIAFSQGILKSLVESYRKIRNTFRFMLGNLHGFDPAEHAVPLAEMTELDRWMLARFGRYLDRIDRAYDEYDFHHVFHGTIELATVELSSFYLDIIKDRVYCDAPEGLSRRSAQTVLYALARDTARALAPVLSFTAEDVWQNLPAGSEEPDSVFLAGFPEVPEKWRDEALLDRMEALREVRRQATRLLEERRAAKQIGNSLEAEIGIRASGATLELLREVGGRALADLFIVSGVEVEEGRGPLAVTTSRSEAAKCPRCWRYGHGIGEDARRPELCARCAGVVEDLVARGEAEV